MSMAPRIYSSEDPGAPALTGQAGSLADLLRAVLVTGYGSGAAAREGLGWTIEYYDGQVIVFRNSPVFGTGSFIRVDDRGAIGSARQATLRGYSDMDAADSGTNPFPATSHPNGSVFAKSSTLDSSSRPWIIIGTPVGIYYMPEPVPGYGRVPYYFGDFDSALSPDPGGCMVAGSPVTSNWPGSPSFNFTNLFNGSGVMGHAAGWESGLAATQLQSWSLTAQPAGGQGLAYEPGRRFAYSDVVFGRSTTLVRGRLPGVIAPMHFRPFPDLSIVEDMEGLQGLIFQAVDFHTAYLTTSSNQGQVLFQVNGEWP